jgi:hypothetical protein
MCIYVGVYRATEISFLKEDMFQEKGQIFINHPRNSDDFNDKTLPTKISIHHVMMKKEQKEEIAAMFAKRNKLKEKAKSRKKLRA